MAKALATYGGSTDHRPDPDVAYAESIGALADLLDAGKIQMAGISNATVARSTRRRRCWAVDSSACRTYSHPGSAHRRVKWSTANASTWPSSHGAPSAHPSSGSHRPRVPRLCRSGRRSRHDTRAGHPGLDAGEGLPGDPHTREQSTGHGNRLRSSSGDLTHRRSGGTAQRSLPLTTRR